MNAEFIEALNAIEKERGISKDILIDAFESALIAAYKRNYGAVGNVRATVDRDTGEVQIFASKTVTETVENPYAEISLAEAKKINSLYEVGDVLEEEVDPRKFGRIAAQTAKQVVVQRIREAERGVIFDEFVEKENEVLTAIVQRVEKNGIYVELGKTDGFLAASETIAGETYNTSDRLKVYVLEVRKTNKGPQVIVSRTHPGLVKRLFELEVPEIQTGIVQIKSIAREAGFRTKVAVYSSDPQVDAVGACVGQKGIRVERIVNELHNEKIDIIEWDPDPAVYIAKSLSPARVMMVYINEAEKAAKVIVPDNQLSLAIGKEGQNVRLAAKLTGWKIDIKSQSQAEEDMDIADADSEADGGHVFYFLFPADIAGIYAHLVGAVFDGGHRQRGRKMNIRHERQRNALLYGPHRRRVRLVGYRRAHDFAARLFQRVDLPYGSLDVRRLRRRHRLDLHAGAAADLYPADKYPFRASAHFPPSFLPSDGASCPASGLGRAERRSCAPAFIIS